MRRPPVTAKAEAVRDGHGDPSCSRHGMMADPKGNGRWICAQPRCKVTTDYDSEDPDQ